MPDNLNPPTRRGLPILALDFDGVLHSYTSGWQGADVISDPPVPGAIEFLMEAVEHFEVTFARHAEDAVHALRRAFNQFIGEG